MCGCCHSKNQISLVHICNHNTVKILSPLPDLSSMLSFYISAGRTSINSVRSSDISFRFHFVEILRYNHLMFPANFSTVMNVSLVWLAPALFLLGIFLGIFLFWRAGRHELIETEKLLDTAVVSLLGAILFSRIFDFLIRSQFYQWSFKKLIFVNAYWGFDYYGALFGLAVSGLIYLALKRANFLQIFDLAAAPVVFVQIVYYLSKFLGANLMLKQVSFNLNKDFFYFIFYFLIYFVIVRLSAKRRHAGFFGCFYLVFVAVFNLTLRFSFSLGRIPSGKEGWHAVFEAAVLILGLFLWYFLARRKLKEDVKSLVAFFLLSIFRTKRILTSQEEAGKFAKTVLFVPLNLVRSFYLAVRFAVLEIYLGFVEFVNVFKGKK